VALVRAIRESPLTLLAAAIAYYAFVSLFPLLLLGLVVATTLGGEALASTIVDGLGGVLSPAAEDLVRSTLLRAEARGSATLLGIAVLGWGGLKLFRGIDVAFSEVYGTTDATSFPEQLRNAVAALAAVGAALVVTVLVGIAAGALGIAFAGVIGTAGLVVVLTGVFFPLYYIFPGVDLTPRDALPGAAFAAVGWTVLGSGFRIYAAGAGTTDLYGVVGTVLLLVTWFYLGGLVLLLGAVVNGVRSGHVGIEPAGDRQLQQGSLRVGGQRAMSTTGDEGAGVDDEGTDADDEGAEVDDEGADADDEGADANQVAQLRADLDTLQSRVDERTVHREEIEGDLQQYVRWRVRRGHASGWGPYLVLLYGTVMTVAAFYFLSGFWAVAAMLVVWLSTLGLYVVMIVIGVTFTVLGLPGRLRDRIRDWRS